MSRGRFVALAGAAAAVAGGLLPLGSGLTGADAASPPATERPLDLAEFRACVGEKFRIGNGTITLVATLAKVTDLKAGKTTGKSQGECFVLQFRSRDSSFLTQNTYRFEHSRLGSFPLFIVPAGPGKDGGIYEAVINRIDASSLRR